MKSSNSCQEFNLDIHVQDVTSAGSRSVVIGPSGARTTIISIQSLRTLTPSLINATTIKVYEAPAHANRDRSFDLDSLVPWRCCAPTRSRFHGNGKGWLGGY